MIIIALPVLARLLCLRGGYTGCILGNLRVDRQQTLQKQRYMMSRPDGSFLVQQRDQQRNSSGWKYLNVSRIPANFVRKHGCF
jgi:hypothetical protein